MVQPMWKACGGKYDATSARMSAGLNSSSHQADLTQAYSHNYTMGAGDSSNRFNKNITYNDNLKSPFDQAANFGETTHTSGRDSNKHGNKVSITIKDPYR